MSRLLSSFRVVPIVLGLLLTPVAARAQAAPQPSTPALFPAEARIGFVNFDTVLTKSNAAKDALSKLKAFRDKKLFDLGEEQKQADALQTKLKGGASLDESARADLAKNLEKMQRQIQFDADGAQAEFDRMRQDSLTALQQRVLPIVAGLAKERRLDAVFSVTDAATLFIDPRVDLSDEVSQRLDAAQSQRK